MEMVEMLAYYGIVAVALQIGGIARCVVVPQSRGGLLLAFVGSMMGVSFALTLGAMVYGR